MVELAAMPHAALPRCMLMLSPVRVGHLRSRW